MAKITIDGTEYETDDLSDDVKRQVQNVSYCDRKIEELKNEAGRHPDGAQRLCPLAVGDAGRRDEKDRLRQGLPDGRGPALHDGLRARRGPRAAFRGARRRVCPHPVADAAACWTSWRRGWSGRGCRAARRRATPTGPAKGRACAAAVHPAGRRGIHQAAGAGAGRHLRRAGGRRGPGDRHRPARRARWGLALDFKGGEQVLETIPFSGAALRQWLGVLYRNYCRAGWGGDFWPGWITADHPQANTARLN